MAYEFKRATKQKIKARVALDGPAGAGKTMSALKIASALVPGGRIALIDTERASASRYANLFAFDVLELESFAPSIYVQAIQAAARARYDVIIVDSLSHAWSGKDGALDMAGGKFSNWREVTPQHNALVDALLTVPAHVFVTMRTHTEYLVTEEDVNGRKRQKVERVGLKPVQKQGSEYEFDLVGDMTLDNVVQFSKTRCPELKGRSFMCPGEDVAKILRAWLDDGAEPAPLTTEQIAMEARKAAEATETAASEAVVDEAIRVLIDAATSSGALAAIAAERITPLKLAKDSPRRARLLAWYAAAMSRIAAAAAAQDAEQAEAQAAP